MKTTNTGRSLSSKGSFALIPLMVAAQAQGLEFYKNGIEAQLDSQISIGSSWRMEDQGDYQTRGLQPGTTDINKENRNDGDLNYNTGEAFSQIFKGSHDLQVNYENVGLFMRGKYWHDAALEQKNELDDSTNHALAKYTGATILDAFVYGEFETLGMPLDLRLGKQVVSWGESTFIRNGINQVNPVDVSAFRRPGAEIKEGLIPVNMAFASLGLSENLSAEMFYQLGYQESVIDDCGTYFSTNDYAAKGCTTITTTAGKLSRSEDEKPKSDGQFGLALRYFSEALDTEFGGFAMNIHSRTPSVGGIKASFNELAMYDELENSGVFLPLANALTPATVAGGYNGLVAAATADPATYGAALAAVNFGAATFTMAGLNTNKLYELGLPGAITNNITPMSYAIEYIEDQKIVGLSFATNVAGLAFSGEVSHRLDVPMQINSVQLISASLLSDATYAHVYKQTLASPNTATNAAALGTSAEALAEGAARAQVKSLYGSFGEEVLDQKDGTYISGTKPFDISQAQVTAIKLFDQALGASSVALVAEAGYTFIHGFDDDAFTKFGNLEAPVTQKSWGYRGLLSATYNNAFSGVNLSPTLSVGHDVEGVSSNFKEGQYTLGLSLKAEYLNTYSTALGYNLYDGGNDNEVRDRDFVSLTAGIQF